MTGLLLKEFYVQKSMIKSYFFMLGVFLILSLVGVYQFSFFAGMLGLVLITQPTTGFAYDEQSGWDKYAASTPAGRRGVVCGKYLCSLISWLAILALLLAFCLVMALFFPERLQDASFPSLLSSVSVGLLMVDVLLPILFQFGSQKSRVALMIVVGVTTASLVVLLPITKNGASMPPALSHMGLLLPALALAGMPISYFVSLGIYQRKEL